MPIREYQAKDSTRACSHCRKRFEIIERIGSDPIQKCPRCGIAVARVISAPAVGASKSGLDDRAKQAGFHKLKKTGKGEYEKMY